MKTAALVIVMLLMAGCSGVDPCADKGPLCRPDLPNQCDADPLATKDDQYTSLICPIGEMIWVCPDSVHSSSDCYRSSLYASATLSLWCCP